MLCKEMKEMCLAVECGETRLVQHEGLRYVGEVKACHGNRLEVDAFEHTFDWAAERCRPIGERVERLGPPSNG